MLDLFLQSKGGNLTWYCVVLYWSCSPWSPPGRWCGRGCCTESPHSAASWTLPATFRVQHFSQSDNWETHISTDVGLGVGIVALGVVVCHDLTINLGNCTASTNLSVDSKKTNQLDLTLSFLIVCLSPGYLQFGFNNILNKQAFNPPNSNREKDLNI